MAEPSRERDLRIPPCNIEAEQAVLGAMLLGADAVERALGLLGREDFYREAHGHIFQAMADLFAREREVDAVTVKEELVRRGVYELIGGALYIMELGDVVPTAANLAHYAAIVKEKATLRRLAELGWDAQQAAFAPDADAKAVLEMVERKVLAAGGPASREDTWKPWTELQREALERAEEKSKQVGALAGWPVGLHALDGILSGWEEGGLYILAARPSMGKTAAAVTIAARAALRKKRVGLFSQEMTAEQVTDRMHALVGGVPLWRIREGKLRDRDWHALEAATNRLWDAKILVDDASGLTPARLRAKALRMRRELGGLDFVAIDYLQLLHPNPGRRSDNTSVEVGEIAESMKGLAKELKVPVLLLSQLNRNTERREDKRPVLSDLADSGKIEAHADVVLFLYRPAYYEKKEAWTETERVEGQAEEVEVIVAKHRQGETGMVRLGFQGDLTRFANLAPDDGTGDLRVAQDDLGDEIEEREEEGQ